MCIYIVEKFTRTLTKIVYFLWMKKNKKIHYSISFPLSLQRTCSDICLQYFSVCWLANCLKFLHDTLYLRVSLFTFEEQMVHNFMSSSAGVKQMPLFYWIKWLDMRANKPLLVYLLSVKLQTVCQGFVSDYMIY